MTPVTPTSSTTARQPEQPMRSLRHRAPLLWLLIPWMIGLIAAKTVSFPLSIVLLLVGSLCLAATALILLFRKVEAPHKAPLFFFVPAIVLAAAACYEINRSRLSEWENLPPREARLTLRITHVFARADTSKTIGGFARITAAEPHLADLVGQNLYFSLTPPKVAADSQTLAPKFIRTTEITTIGLLEPLPRNLPADTFEGYLASSGMNFRFTRGRILSVEKPPSQLAIFYDATLQQFSRILSQGLEHRPDQANVLRAMTLGMKRGISEEQSDIFLRSGSMHLFAISGLHIGVISVAIQTLLLLVRLPRWPQFLLGTLALWIYVQATGASPSAIRAFGMITLLQAAFVLRLPINPVATLTFAALVTLIIWPMQLFSASFQMSYGMVAALLLYGLPLGEKWQTKYVLYRDIPTVTLTWWQKLLVKWHRGFLGVLGIGVAASLVSAICSVIYFKLFTPGAFFANMLLIPAAGMAITSGFVSLICGLIGFTPGSILFNHASAVLLLIMEKGLALFLKIPGISWSATFVHSWAGYIAFILLIATLCFGYAQRWTLKRGGFWLPLATVMLTYACVIHFG